MAFEVSRLSKPSKTSSSSPVSTVPTLPDQVVLLLVRIGSIPVLLWPASVFNPAPPAPVVPTPRRIDRDGSTRLSVLASLDSLKRAYRPRRRRLIPDETEPMEDVEFTGPSPWALFVLLVYPLFLVFWSRFLFGLVSFWYLMVFWSGPYCILSAFSRLSLGLMGLWCLSIFYSLGYWIL